MLRNNQSNAITCSIENDFASGVHFQATGTGKSWIALHLALAFNQRYPHANLLWLCEQKSILSDQFDRSVLKERHFDSIPKTFLIMNYSNEKPSEWVENVNSSRVWSKPKLIIVNRAFLTSQTKYTKLRLPIHLVIHDECHSIVNLTTQAFYDWLSLTSPDTRIIGFSATPFLERAPFTRLLSQYSIYDAVKDHVIVPPHISWISDSISVTNDAILEVVQDHLPQLPYQKIIIWCGMMDECITAARSWKTYFPGYLVCVDMSESTPEFGSYEQFECASGKAFLFCACKHREGSDIPRLDACVFLDKVEDRNAKTFVQCMGRVLRLDKDGRKTSGWVLDCCARSSYQMCERIHAYLSQHAKLDSFPWKYTFDTQPQPSGSLRTVHHLCMETSGSVAHIEPLCVSRQDIIDSFQRTIPDDERYHQRLMFELDVLEKRELFSYLKQACHILEWTKTIPHVTRGSCGSSLVCYLLGISHVDPVYYGISFARFTSEMRTSLPDIDFDFPYHLRDQVFLALELHWPGKIARISNHVFFHEKSATRQALRDMGMRGFIAKEDMRKTLESLSPDKKTEFEKRKNALEETFRGYMLHCGGITYYAEGVPTELIIPHSHGMLPQISLNKIDVANEKRFKIDILSSRGLAQLHECAGFKNVQFHVDDKDIDSDTMDMLCRGDNLGITQGESCLMRQAFRLIQPRTIEHIAICLAIIRPVAQDSKKEDVDEIKDHQWLVFDDDAITIIADLFKCSEAEADVYRRYFSKRDKKGMSEFKKRLKKLTQSTDMEKINQLKNLHLYSFCKSHAFSYAQMVYQLAYYKCHYPERFWRATLNHVESSYAKWVHLYEATCQGVDTRSHLASVSASIYAQHRRKGIHGMSPIQQLRKYGYWDMSDKSFFPGCVRFNKNDKIYFYGVIACKRVYRSKRAMVYIGIGPNDYMTLHIPKWFGKAKAVIIKGSGKGTKESIECDSYTLI